MLNRHRKGTFLSLASALVLALLVTPALSARRAFDTQTSKPFMGAKANKGHVTMALKDGHMELTLSDDFVVPETPDPHWRLVDSKGNTYLMQRCMVKENKLNKTIVVPTYVPDVVKVQIWCAFAETNLGEAAFECPQMGS